jgi:hypothetical protein
MTTVTIDETSLQIEVEGLDKIWSLKSHLTVPLVHVAEARYDPEIARGWWHGIRMPGTQIPGVITAGTFYQDGNRVFWDVHNPESTIVIVLHDERFQELVIEVENPEDTAAEITRAATAS